VAAPLRVAYLLEDTDLSGGVRVQLAQADALIARGHQITLCTKGPPLTWRASNAEWAYVTTFYDLDVSEFDFVVGTFWSTVPAAYELAGDRAVHLCQGYEGSFTAYEHQRAEIEKVYRLPVPKIVVATPLIEVCRTFHPDVTYIGQIVDDSFFRRKNPGAGTPPRVLLAGASQVDFKGIDVGYGAATHCRWFGGEFSLVRVSPWAPSKEEPVKELVDEFHVALTSSEMTALVHSCDIFLGPSRRQEGFGLPAAEAMASSLPVVLTKIPSFLSFAPSHDYALFAEEEDAEGLGEHLRSLLADPDLREQLGARGHEVAEQFRSTETAARLERFLYERRNTA